MRVQTSFEKFSQITNGSVFSVCFIGLRLVLGIMAFALVTHSAPEQLSLLGVSSMLATLAYVLQIIVAVCFLVGLFVRPAACMAVLFIVITFCFDKELGQHLGEALPTLGIAFVFGLYAAGGSGHILGLDGIIYRNLRHPNALTKFLFG